jgi:hypothetical protein
MNIICFIFDHKYVKPFEFRKNKRLVSCSRCKARFAMNDEHKAFLRYDNDEAFKTGLKRMYPELKDLDI